MTNPYEQSRLFPPSALPLQFDIHDQQRAWDLLGSNCGPGAIAALCGSTPEAVARLLGEQFLKLKGTTEIMLRQALDDLVMPWEDAAPGWVDYGIARVQWDGPWIHDPDPFKKFRHSHWIGVSTRGLPHVMIFDINAISVGGWISLSEWDAVLRPWLLEACEAEATGRWHISEAIRLLPEARASLTGSHHR